MMFFKSLSLKNINKKTKFNNNLKINDDFNDFFFKKEKFS